MKQESYDYENRKGLKIISWDDFHSLCKGLALALEDYNPEIILPIGRAGFYPGTLISHLMKKEIYPIRLSRRQEDRVIRKTPEWLMEPPALIRNKKVIILDEISSTGQTLDLARDKAGALGAAVVRTAVLYAHKKGIAAADYIGIITDELVINPWDRELLEDRTFVFHPEYEEALKDQGSADMATLVPNVIKAYPTEKAGP